MAQLDKAIRPIAKRPIDTSRPGWQEELATMAPLDEAGVRQEAEDLILRVIAYYLVSNSGQRETVRELFRRFDSFAWAIRVPLDRRTEEGWRSHLVHFSIVDQPRDPRDAKLWLQDLCDEGRRGGFRVREILREVAVLSSSHDRHGWGSTREWLEEASRQ